MLSRSFFIADHGGTAGTMAHPRGLVHRTWTPVTSQAEFALNAVDVSHLRLDQSGQIGVHHRQVVMTGIPSLIGGSERGDIGPSIFPDSFWDYFLAAKQRS
jgi:hypothetical protein